MISFDFEYKKPQTWKDAINEYMKQREAGKNSMYFAGGTEFISRARMNEVQPDVIIDINSIPECRTLTQTSSTIIIGAAVTLTDIIEANLFPLLSEVARNIATKTARNKITLGGNIMSNLPYKEALLPLLVASSNVTIATKNGLENRCISEVFSESNHLKDEQFIVQINTDVAIAKQPFYKEKRTKQSSVNYPILTSSALFVDGEARVAFSGLCDFPFRLKTIDNIISDRTTSEDMRVQNILNSIPAPILDDMNASERYRSFVFKQMLMKIMSRMGELAK